MQATGAVHIANALMLVMLRASALAAFAEPWHAVASVVLYMRTGALTETKREHQQIPAASEAEMIAIRGEMPAALLDPAFIVELP